MLALVNCRYIGDRMVAKAGRRERMGQTAKGSPRQRASTVVPCRGCSQAGKWHNQLKRCESDCVEFSLSSAS
jgi:hypothetical protein